MVYVSSFSRIDTVTVPDVFMSVAYVSDGEDDYDADSIKTLLETDRDSIDFLAIASDSDPLCFPELYKLIKSIRPSGIKVVIITDGRNPSVLDDLIGAGYAHAVDLKVGAELTDTQKECIRISEENGCQLTLTIDLSEHNEESVIPIVKSAKGCKRVVLKQVKNNPLKKSELSAISAAIKHYIWDVKLS